ncbi:MAG: hypothetical protein QME74_01795 [Candidatus Edwardsbacteria bacterium]|nr:hypothetical protein [Candidatus Edwardsbacteria bacterium]
MKILTICFVAILLIVPVGCSKKNPTGNTSIVPDYYPLSVGSWWQYSGTMIRVDKDSIIGTVAFPGNITCYCVFRRWMIDTVLGDTFTTYISKTAHEVRRYYILGDTAFYSVAMRFPIAVGNAWAVRVYDSIQYYDSMRVIGTGNVSVPAGLFTGCYRILHKYYYGREDPGTSELWFAPNVGFVYSPGIADTTRLINYQIK